MISDKKIHNSLARIKDGDVRKKCINAIVLLNSEIKKTHHSPSDGDFDYFEKQFSKIPLFKKLILKNQIELLLKIISDNE